MKIKEAIKQSGTHFFCNWSLSPLEASLPFHKFASEVVCRIFLSWFSFSSLPFVVPSFTTKNQAEKRSPFIEKLTLIGPGTHAVAWSCQEQAVPAYLPGLGGVRTVRWVV